MMKRVCGISLRANLMTVVSGLCLATAFAHAESAPVSIQPVTTERPLAVATGIVDRPAAPDSTASTGPSASQASSLPIMLMSPQDLGSKNFGSALSTAMLSDSAARDFEKKYQDNSNNYEMRRKYFATSADSNDPVSHEMTERYELDGRQAETKEVKRYMLLKGVPAFLASREDTKLIGKAYQTTVDKVNGATTFSGKTGGKNSAASTKHTDPWTYTAGVNPLAQKGWFNYSNSKWFSQVATNFKDFHGSTGCVLRRDFRQSRIESDYFFFTKIMTPAYVYNWRPNLSTALVATIPMTSKQVFNDISYTAKLGYTF